MRKIMEHSDFRKKFSTLASDAKVNAQTMQDLLEDALAQASHPASGGHGSCNRLDIIVAGLANMGTMPTRTIQNYIKAHADVKYGKLDDGRKGHKFVGGTPSVTMPEVTWWEWKGNENKTAKIDVDIVASLKSLESRIKTAHKKGGNVEHEELLPEIKALIQKAKDADKAAKESKTDEPVPSTDW